MTKQELMETYTAEQLAEMVVDLQNIPIAGKINCENSGSSDLIKLKCDKCGEEFLAFLDEKYILCKKTELDRAKNTINQIDDILEKLFGVRHDTANTPDEFEKVLTDKARANISDFLPTEPIKVADMLINAMCKPCASVLSFGKPYILYDMSELRQIAEHLLVYYNHNKEGEE